LRNQAAPKVCPSDPRTRAERHADTAVEYCLFSSPEFVVGLQYIIGAQSQGRRQLADPLMMLQASFHWVDDLKTRLQLRTNIIGSQSTGLEESEASLQVLTVTKGRGSFDDGREAWFARTQDRSRILSLLAGWIARLDASIVDPRPVDACLRCAESTYI
jgi:hypothetical protein